MLVVLPELLEPSERDVVTLMTEARLGTRIDCEIHFTLASVDPAHSFSEPCTAILVNLQGCAAQFGRSLKIGTAVQLEDLPGRHKVSGRIVNCFWPGEFAKFWILGLALDTPGNVWGIKTPPDDWHIDVPTVQVERSTSSDRPLILCLEDDPSYLRLRKTVLEKNGYEIIGVSAAEDALLTLRSSPVCLVISDHMLRGTTGTALAGELKQIKPDVPIILHSGQQPDTLENVDVFINKEVSTQEFLALVRDVVQRSSS